MAQGGYQAALKSASIEKVEKPAVGSIIEELEVEIQRLSPVMRKTKDRTLNGMARAMHEMVDKIVNEAEQVGVAI